MREMFLVFDIGGTKLRLAISKDSRTLENLKIFETPKIYAEAIEVFNRYISTVSADEKITAGAGGLQGVRDSHKSMLISPPEHSSFPDWREKPLKSDLQNLINGPVFLENDAAMVGIGEASFGPGKGNKIVAYITISTGVGGARIVEEKIDQNSFGFEPGNQVIIIDPKKINGSLDSLVTLDNYISGSGIERRLGQKAEEIKDPDFWDEIARLLAVGLNNTIVHWSPDILILGGSVMKSIDVEKVKKYLREILTIYPTLPEIERASLEDEGGLYGGLTYLKNIAK